MNIYIYIYITEYTSYLPIFPKTFAIRHTAEEEKEEEEFALRVPPSLETQYRPTRVHSTERVR